MRLDELPEIFAAEQSLSDKARALVSYAMHFVYVEGLKPDQYAAGMAMLLGMACGALKECADELDAINNPT